MGGNRLREVLEQKPHVFFLFGPQVFSSCQRQLLREMLSLLWFNPHFTVEETEAQREVTHLRSDKQCLFCRNL